MKKVYIMAAAFASLSQSASALSCYFDCSANACEDQSRFEDCSRSCNVAVTVNGRISGTRVSNCIIRAQGQNWFPSSTVGRMLRAGQSYYNQDAPPRGNAQQYGYNGQR